MYKIADAYNAAQIDIVQSMAWDGTQNARPSGVSAWMLPPLRLWRSMLHETGDEFGHIGLLIDIPVDPGAGESDTPGFLEHPGPRSGGMV